MVRQQLKHHAKQTMFASRQPHVLMVTVPYIVIAVTLGQLIHGLSDLGQLWSALWGQMPDAIETFSRVGVMPRLVWPGMTISSVGTFFFIAPWIFLWIMHLGYVYYVRGIARGETLGYRSIFEGFNYFIRGVLVRLVYVVIVGFGLILGIAPGVVLICGFSQVNFLLLDHPDRGTFWLMRKSWRLMRQRKWEYFELWISFSGWYLLRLVWLIGPAAQIWFAPYYTFTMMNYYQAITGQGAPPDAGWQRPGMF